MQDGKHKGNLQELFPNRIKVSEVLFALERLRKGGAFIVKLFNTKSLLMVSFIYACARAFESTGRKAGAQPNRQQRELFGLHKLLR